MANYKEKLKQINTFIFDFDGVLSNGKVWVLSDGDQLRATNVKDGYAIQYALRNGFNVCIISGGYSPGMQKRYKDFPGMDIFLKVSDKKVVYSQYLKDKNIDSSQVLYMGDDIPDYEVMEMSFVKACPRDAVVEIKEISDYISSFNGGEGCVRDIIEQTLRVQKKWFNENACVW